MIKLSIDYRWVFGMVLLVCATSCERLVEVPPPVGGLERTEVFEDDLLATAAISRLYTHLEFNSFNSIELPTSLSADDLMRETVDDAGQFYQNEIFPKNSTIETAWRTMYTTIYNANSIMEGLVKSDKLTPALKNQLMGEAKFFRAFTHFYLVNLFGPVPYITSTDYTVNATMPRMPITEVYEKILTDLTEAKELLSADYSYSNNERVRVNKWVATALLARVYLYRGDWARAEEQASRAIDQTALFKLDTACNDVFFKNSEESIWQVIPEYPQKFTTAGNNLNQPTYNAGSFTVTQELFNAFEAGDKRKANWIGIGSNSQHTWYYALKYKRTAEDTTSADEYYTVFRLAEQYLIRAEARAKQDKLTGTKSAQADLDVIRSRAGLVNTAATTQPALLLAIEQERRVELFTEWGHRWLDLKRTGRVHDVLSAVKPHWQDTDTLYPIPYAELQLNPFLTQNKNYN